jgi:hypothetical protein
MRTTVTIDDDVYELAKLCAWGKGITFSAALNELVRKGLSTIGSGYPSQELVQAPDGMPAFRSRGRVLTSEMVKKKHQEDEIE